MVDEELQGDWVNERDFNPDPLLFIDDEQANAPAPPIELRAAPNGDRREFATFVDRRTCSRSASRASARSR